MKPKSLDMICASHAQKFVKDAKVIPRQNKSKSKIDDLVTKSAGVLQENGLYAFVLFLYSQKKNTLKAARKIIEHTVEIIKDSKLYQSSDSEEFDIKKVVETIANDPQKLIFAKSLVDRFLVYARYHAKGIEESRE